jgi:predicted DNA-binding protein
MKMPTKNQRINITTNEKLMSNIALIAKQEKKTVSTLAKELIEEALDKREDMYLSTIANSREVESKKVVQHTEAWK